MAHTPRQSYTNLARLHTARDVGEPARASTDSAGSAASGHMAPTTPNRSRAATAVRTPNVATTTGDRGKKSLIDQFYNAVNDNLSASVSPVGHAASGGGIASSGYTSEAGDAGAARAMEPLSDATMRSIIRRGGVKYLPMDNKIYDDDALADYLLNIDNMGAEERTRAGGEPLWQLERLVGDLAATMMANVRDQITATAGAGHRAAAVSPASKLQILRLQTYVRKLQQETASLAAELKANKRDTWVKYQREIERNVEKLRGLSQTLEQLEARMAASRSQIARNKATMHGEIERKLRVLEQVDRRMKEHAAASKERRLRFMSAAVAVAVLLAGLWWGMLHRK
ncbi:t-SNARE coiled-coil domain-containing protein [[Candida] zeylanoides]